MDAKFITTYDKSTASLLTAQGFHPLPDTSSRYVFVLESGKKIDFDEIDVSKIKYTNTLNI